ncbi:MAG TPA: tetratricopeptide repeat protein, partial [Vicinamibacterales bacterium]
TLEPGPADTAEVWISIGRLAGEAQAPDVGEPFLRRAVQMAPDLSSAHELLGMTLVDLNRWDEADRELAAAVRLDPHAARAFAYLAACEAQLGRVAEAKADAQTALQLDPSSAIARQVLAAVAK